MVPEELVLLLIFDDTRLHSGSDCYGKTLSFRFFQFFLLARDHFAGCTTL